MTHQDKGTQKLETTLHWMIVGWWRVEQWYMEQQEEWILCDIQQFSVAPYWRMTENRMMIPYTASGQVGLASVWYLRAAQQQLWISMTDYQWGDRMVCVTIEQYTRNDAWLVISDLRRQLPRQRCHVVRMMPLTPQIEEEKTEG